MPGKLLIIIGVILIAVGLLVTYGQRIPMLGRLPGDIVIKKENFSFYFPLTTSILVSVIISLIFYFISRK